MKPCRFILLLLILGGLVAHPGVGLGFMPNPDLLTITPAVARAGSTVEVTIKGKHLDEARSLRFTHPEIKAEPVMLQADDFHPEPRSVNGRFAVTIPADLEPGIYEVRSFGYFGLSTARPFVVLASDSDLGTETGDHASAETALPIEIEAGMLGTLDSGKFDWYRFSAKKGERLLIHCWAERIDSKADVLMALVDAEGRELESSRHHDPFGRDPLIDFTAPSDGDYFLSLSDALYLGSGDHFYYLKVTRNPHIDFVFPPAGVPGTEQRFTLFGRNLPGGSLGEGWEWAGKPLETLERQLPVPEAVTHLPGFHWSIPRQGMLPGFEHREGASDPVRIGFATAPLVVEDAAKKEQRIVIPTEIAGRFDEAGDSDQFRFTVEQDGGTYWIEVISHRLGVIADPLILVEKIEVAENGEETATRVVEVDDLPSFYGRDSLDDLNADSRDPAASFTAKEAGEYRVTLINQSAGGSAAHLYRLAIREAQPDFQLIVGTELTKTINNDAYPNAPVIRRNGSMVFRVMAFRQDGFEGDISITARGLPDGVTAKPLVLSGKSREGFLTLWAAAEASAWSGPIQIVGGAELKEGEDAVERKARSASILWGRRVFGNQAQVRSRLDGEVVLSVLEVETDPTRIEPAEEKVWTVEMNQSLEIPFKVIDSGPRVGNLQVNVHGFPGWHRSPPSVSVAEGASEGKLTLPIRPSGNFEIAPGRYQFVLQGIGNRKYRHNPGGAERAEREVKRLESLEEAVKGEVEQAKADLTEREKVWDSAKQKAAGAADDAARKAQEAETKAAEAAVAEGKQALANVEARLKQFTQNKDTAVKAAKVAETLAKEKSNQFATYSLPITVEVKEVAPAEK